MGPYKLLLAFGPNLVASEGDEWKRQRKLVAPAFSEVRVLSLFAADKRPIRAARVAAHALHQGRRLSAV